MRSPLQKNKQGEDSNPEGRVLKKGCHPSKEMIQMKRLVGKEGVLVEFSRH